MKTSHRLLRDKDYVEQVREDQKSDKLNLAMRFNACASLPELDMLCERTAECLMRPWLVPSRNSKRFKDFWNKELDEMAKVRTRP